MKKKYGSVFKEIKVILLILLSGILLMPSKSSAHLGDYFSGVYVASAPSQPSYMNFMVDSSALNGSFTQSVFSSISSWNNLSSNVHVLLTYRAPGMPSNVVQNYYLIYGSAMYSGFSDPTLFGVTVPRNSSGTILQANDNWYRVEVYLNTSSGYLNDSTKAKKVFLHEIGHCLKLSHPIENSSLLGHNYNGKPMAIMNQGLPNALTGIASTVQGHDVSNLQAKWGS